jgi:predicted Zn-dependent protease
MLDTCRENVAAQDAADELVLSSASVCVDVGYLCAELERSGSQRILRWPQDTGRLRIRVPLPAGVSPERARDLQSAAVRGIQYWQRRPFELVIDTHPTSSAPADIEVSWGKGLSGTQLGLTRVRWSFEQGEANFEVLGLALAVRSPAGPRYELAPQQVLLTAAHEMGHALGLPHSDSERDVMYPTNTARNLSNRDFRTLDALYRLPNGAEIEKKP